MSNKPFLQNYSGQSAQELIEMASEYRIDSIVLAFEDALGKKFEVKGIDSLTIPELTILAIEAMEREVNSGGWDSFFSNSSRLYAVYLYDSLVRIGCPKTARIAKEALEVLNIEGGITEEAIEDIISADDEEREDRLSELDSEYYSNDENIEVNLFSYIKNHENEIKLS